jgi:hypothetical protein
MKAAFISLLTLSFLFSGCSHTDGALGSFDWRRAPGSAGQAVLAELSQEEIASALKEALSQGIGRAVATLGRENGFLSQADVKIPMPENLQTVERTLRTLRQGKLADEFIVTMNRAAEQAVPEAAFVLGQAVKQMSIADAKSILVGGSNEATQYFQRTSESLLYERFLPIVQQATEQAGVTSAYKKLTGAVGGGLAGVAGNVPGFEMPDLDSYITRKTLDGLFLRIAEEEQLIRDNPVARTTHLLQKVFGAVSR